MVKSSGNGPWRRGAAEGAITLLAQAQDSDGIFSDLAALMLTVQ
jgi:hypothetical protein